MLGRFASWLGFASSSSDDAPVRVDLDAQCVTCFEVSLSAGLQEEDVWFQLHLEAQSQNGLQDTPVAIDYELLPPKEGFSESNRSHSLGSNRYRVYAVPLAWVESLQTIATTHHLHMERVGVLAQDDAFGRSASRIDFLPHRQRQWQRQQRLWWWYAALALLTGVLSVCVLQWVRTVWATQNMVSEPVRLATLQAVSEHQMQHAQWTQSTQFHRRAHQQSVAQSAWQQYHLQWQRVLQNVSSRLWFQQVWLAGALWRLKGQALSEQDVQSLQAKLQALPIWQQTPKVEQLVLLPASDSARLPVWQFELVGAVLGMPAVAEAASP